MRIESSPLIKRLRATSQGHRKLSEYLFVMSKDINKSESVYSLLKKMAERFSPGDDGFNFFWSARIDLYERITNYPDEVDACVYARLVIDLKKMANRGLSTLRHAIETLRGCGFNDDDAMQLFEDELGVIRCEFCDDYEFDDHTTDSDQVYNGYNGYNAVCRYCISNSFSFSDYYSQWVTSDNAVWALDENGHRVLIHENDDDFVWNDDADSRTHVDYEYKPEIIAGYHSSKKNQYCQPDDWTSANKRYIGVELEVEAVDKSESASKINDVINSGVVGRNAFFENDGSLNNGFEIISQPMSLPAQRSLWAWLKDRKLVKGLKSHNTTTCGLHVHVSKQHLTSLQIAKIVSFVNNPENEGLITSIARRYGQAATGYCRIKDKSKLGKAHQSSDRYEAVNVTPRHTIEFRIFKGSLKYESVISAIEFANAMVEFTKAYSGYGCRDLTSDSFLEFIDKKIPGETKVLREYINNRMENA